MVSINPENIKNVVQSAENGLKKKTLGGFTPESTKEALQRVADGVKQLADNAIGSVQKELQAYKGKSAQEMAELTSKKDAVIISKDNEIKAAAEKLADAKQQIKAAKSVKIGKPKTLQNGNIETVKVNKNGARMTTETTPDGRKVQVSVETINGDIRKTKFDPVSEKAVKTYTNTNGEKLINYDADGKAIKETSVNVKKVKPQKPKLVSDQIVEENKNSYIQKIRKSYSDGSYEMADYNSRRQEVVGYTKFNAEGKKVEDYKEGLKSKYNPETGKVTEQVADGAYGTKTKILYTEAGIPYEKRQTTQQGLTRIIKAKVDKYGNVNTENPSMKYIYPKNSPIKESNIEYQTQFFVKKETLKMKDGSTVTMGVNSNYGPYDVTITKKGQEPKVLDYDEGQKYLDSIGKVGHRQDNHYYYNVI